MTMILRPCCRSYPKRTLRDRIPKLRRDFTQQQLAAVGAPIGPVRARPARTVFDELAASASRVRCSCAGTGGASSEQVSGLGKGSAQHGAVSHCRHRGPRSRLAFVAVSQHLIGRGHEVVVHTGSVFRERVEATGARFVAFRPEIDIDYRQLDARFPERRKIARAPPSSASD